MLYFAGETIEEILLAVRVSEAAHSANMSQASQMDYLTVEVEHLIENCQYRRLRHQNYTTEGFFHISSGYQQCC
jgi:hypothetical protein